MSIRKSPASNDASSSPPPRRRAPQRRAHARHQLVDAERLGDVVVGARVERFDLRALLALHRQHDDRHARHLADAPAQLDAVHVRHVQIGDDELGRPLLEVRSAPTRLPPPSAPDSPGCSAPSCSTRVICGSSSTTSTRDCLDCVSMSALLCADDGHAALASSAGSAAAAPRRQRSARPPFPCPTAATRSRSGRACASTSRRAIGSPSPMPVAPRIERLAAGNAEELLEHLLAQLRRNARPFVGDRRSGRDARRPTTRATRIVVPAGEYLLALSSRM